jgi:hypothetical protein
MKHVTTIATISGLLLTGTAFAQGAYVEIDDDVQVPALSMSVDALEDMDVYNADGRKIGEVEDVLGAETSTATAVSVEFDASVGEDDGVVELSSLTLEGDQLVLGLDEAAIAELPVYRD